MKQADTKSYNEASVKKSWYQIDATGLSLGRLATQVAVLLQGKHKPQYTPHANLGDFVVIFNCDQVIGQEGSVYYRHSGRMGGLKKRTYAEQMKVSSARVVMLAVKRMITRSPLGRSMMRQLRCYAGAHPHEAQGAQLIDLKQKRTLSEEIYGGR